MTNATETTVKAVKNIWSIILLVAFVFGMGGSWAVWTYKISDLQDESDTLQAKIEKLEEQLHTMQLKDAGATVMLQQIQADITIIKQDIREIKERPR